MPIKTLRIPCSGYSVVADWYDGKTATKILLALPGYSSTRLRQKDLVSAIVKRTGFSALVFDYSGHGDSPFQLRDTRPAQHFLELIYVFDWLKDKYPASEIYVLGASYGSFLATQLTKYREFKKLVLRVPAIYRPESFYNLWSVREDNQAKYTAAIRGYRKNIEELSHHPLLARAQQFKGSTLVVIHEKDELVPKETTDAYIKAFKADSFVAKDFGHNFSEVTNEERISKQILEDYQTRIADWLAR